MSENTAGGGGTVWRTCLKLFYALASGAACVWAASFGPAIGPPLSPHIPANAVALVQIRDGHRVFSLLKDSPALRQFQDDPDLAALADFSRVRRELEAAHAKLPGIVRWLFPFSPEGFFPLAGQESAVVLLPEADAAKASRPKVLVYTRLSGSGGAWVRLAGLFAPLPAGLSFYDLGGGLAAAGLNGAVLPGAAGTGVSFDFASTAVPEASVGRVLVRPAGLMPPGSAGTRAGRVRACAQFRQLAQSLPPKVMDALAEPPAAADIFRTPQLPREVQIEIFAAGDGRLRAAGRVCGLHVPDSEILETGSTAFAEAALPADLRALFLMFLADELRIKPANERLSRAQRRWSEIFRRLHADGIELDRDLWPVFGHVINLEVTAPADDSAWRHGVIRAEVPMDSARTDARAAAHQLFDLMWNYEPGRPALERLKFASVNGADGYVTGMQITAPGWVLTRGRLTATWDAGMLASTDPEAAIRALLNQPRRTAHAGYFLRWDGAKMASTAEALTAHWCDSLEEDLGAQEFLSRCADAPRYPAMARKLSELAGQFKCALQPSAPGANDVSALTLDWVPGQIPDEPSREQPETDRSSVPPPPAAGETDGATGDAAPPPPAN